MRNVAHDRPYLPASQSIPGRFAVWNRRLLTTAVVLILWASSMLALQMVGPDARAMVAGEGMLITSTE